MTVACGEDEGFCLGLLVLGLKKRLAFDCGAIVISSFLVLVKAREFGQCVGFGMARLDYASVAQW
jgi:hypothetical protein